MDGEADDLAEPVAGGRRRERGEGIVLVGVGGGEGGANLFHLGGRDGVAAVAPGAADVGEDVGDLLVVHGGGCGHHALIFDAVDDDGAADALEGDADAAFFVGEEVVGLGERGEDALQALAGGLVAGGAVDLIQGRASARGGFGVGGGGGREGGEERQGDGKRAG